MKRVESFHVGSKLFHSSGSEGVTGGNQHAALVLNQPETGASCIEVLDCESQILAGIKCRTPECCV